MDAYQFMSSFYYLLFDSFIILDLFKFLKLNSDSLEVFRSIFIFQLLNRLLYK